jgi:hypothetical protein
VHNSPHRVFALIFAASLLGHAPVQSWQDPVPESLSRRDGQDVDRARRVAILRAKAKEHIEEESKVYSDVELQDIERRYRSAHDDAFPMLLKSSAVAILHHLIERYPMSNRSGCAVLDLAQLSRDEAREHYLKQAIANYSHAWCESGVQVGALARAQLAVFYAGLQRFDEAERLAAEVSVMFPGAIDSAGAPLDDLLLGIRLLRR